MTSLIASALLAASLAGAPAETPKKEAAPAPAKKEAAAPTAKQAPTPASPAAIKDAKQALLGPCSPEMAGGTVTAVQVLDGNQLNARLEKEKSKKPKAEPAQRFIDVSYTAGATKGKSVRQVSTQYLLTTEQAQVLVGEKLCVIQGL